MKYRLPSGLYRILAALLILLLLAGCTAPEKSDRPENSASAPAASMLSASEVDPGSQASETPENPETPAEAIQDFTVPTSPEAPAFSLDGVSWFDGTAPYAILNDNIPYFSENDRRVTEGFELYSPLDDLGRCGTAYANICPELMPTEERVGNSTAKPTGWHTEAYTGLIEGNYLFNRCHLIGYQLAGETDNTCNLITGTRYLNMTGMLPFENQVTSYVQETGNHVLYRVTPVFTGDDLVAKAVLMEGWSVEDGGAGVCFCVYCYNVQPGIGIEYATGENWPDGSIPTEWMESAPEIEPETEPEEPEEWTEVSEKPENPEEYDEWIEVPEEIEEWNESEPIGTDYVLNTNRMKFHRPGCSSVGDIAEHNRWDYTGSREDVLAMGYEPCKRCNP